MPDVRKIITEEDPQLHQPSIEVQRFGESLSRLLDDMLTTMYAANGVGLAAPQIGINKKIIVVDDREGNLFEMVNPRITKQSGIDRNVEFCLSVPGRGGVVDRAQQVCVEAQDRKGNPFSVQASGYLARILQHEIDHLSGRLFTDIMIKEVREDTDEDNAQKKSPRRIKGTSKNR